MYATRRQRDYGDEILNSNGTVLEQLLIYDTMYVWYNISAVKTIRSIPTIVPRSYEVANEAFPRGATSFWAVANSAVQPQYLGIQHNNITEGAGFFRALKIKTYNVIA
jgi:hypothetical protein